MIVCLLLERLFVLGLDCLEINLLGLYNLELVGVGGRGGGGVGQPGILNTYYTSSFVEE